MFYTHSMSPVLHPRGLIPHLVGHLLSLLSLQLIHRQAQHDVVNKVLAPRRKFNHLPKSYCFACQLGDQILEGHGVTSAMRGMYEDSDGNNSNYKPNIAQPSALKIHAK